MVEGWLPVECMYYLSEYMPKTDEDAPQTRTNAKAVTMTDEVFCGKGTHIRLTYDEKENLSTFIINNSNVMAMQDCVHVAFHHRSVH